MKVTTSRTTNAALCVTRCPHHGSRLRQISCGPRRPYWTNYVDVGDSMPSSTRSLADAFRTTLDLFDAGLDLMRQNLRRSHPAASDEQIQMLLQQWLLERPGSESGDCPGRAIDLSARFA